MRIWHLFSGKPAGALDLDAGRWHRIDAHTPADPVGGLVWHMAYLHVEPRWRVGRTVGAVTARFVRHDDPDGATGYHTWVLHRSAGVDWWPLQPTHFEEGHAGVGGHWEVRLTGGLAGARITTRYVKSQGVGG
jgi:hypothetical protein